MVLSLVEANLSGPIPAIRFATWKRAIFPPDDKSCIRSRCFFFFLYQVTSFPQALRGPETRTFSVSCPLVVYRPSLNPEAEESNGYLLITDLVPHARMRSAACFRAASGYRHESVASVREECVNNPIQGVAYCEQQVTRWGTGEVVLMLQHILQYEHYPRISYHRQYARLLQE